MGEFTSIRHLILMFNSLQGIPKVRNGPDLLTWSNNRSMLSSSSAIFRELPLFFFAKRELYGLKERTVSGTH